MATTQPTHPSPARWVYCASGVIALPTLQALTLQDPPAAVITATHDRNNPVSVWAHAQGLAVIDQHDTVHIEAWLAAHAVDMGVVFSFGRKVPSAWMARTKRGFVNLHPSLLPRWRGASPVVYTIWSGDETTAITLIALDDRWDHGPILAQQRIAVPHGATCTTLSAQIAQDAATAIQGWWGALRDGTLWAHHSPQATQGVTYAPRLTPQQGGLSWAWPSGVIVRTVAALDMWPGAWWMVGTERVKCWAATQVDVPQGAAAYAAGTVCDRHATIRTLDGAVRLHKVQRPGRRVMSGEQMCAGLRLRKGDRIGTQAFETSTLAVPKATTYEPATNTSANPDACQTDA